LAKERNNSTSCQDALKKLIAFINARYSNGGKLPPASEMTGILGISGMTYQKIQKIICKENLAEASASRKGTYVYPASQRRRKVSLVVSDGQPSPFLCYPYLLSSFFRILTDHEICIHIVQGKNVEELYEKSALLCCDCLIYFTPEPKYLPQIRETARKSEIPFLIVCPESVYPGEGSFTMAIDVDFESEIQGEILRRYHPERCLYPYLSLRDFESHYAAFLRQGIDVPRTMFIDKKQIEKGLAGRIRKDIDLILCDCSPKYQKIILEQLMTLPVSRRPDVIPNVPIPQTFRQLCADYPGIHFPGRIFTDMDRMGIELGNLVCSLLKQKKMFTGYGAKITRYEPAE